LGVLVIADPLVKMLFGPAFGPSGPILALMGLVLILTSLNVLLGYSLMSMDRQNEWTLVMAVATVLTLPLDWILIPWCEGWFANGGLAGALSFLITEGGMLIAGIYLVPRGTLTRRNLWLAIRASLAGLMMVAGTWWLRDYFIAIPVLAGVLIYTVAGWILHLVQTEDLMLAKSMLQAGLRRFRPQTVALQEDSHGN
jgi:O-antigen/teichoic acid export membrane protein